MNVQLSERKQTWITITLSVTIGAAVSIAIVQSEWYTWYFPPGQPTVKLSQSEAWSAVLQMILMWGILLVAALVHRRYKRGEEA